MKVNAFCDENFYPEYGESSFFERLVNLMEPYDDTSQNTAVFIFHLLPRGQTEALERDDVGLIVSPKNSGNFMKGEGIFCHFREILLPHSSVNSSVVEVT
jgi:hypothetical protein